MEAIKNCIYGYYTSLPERTLKGTLCNAAGLVIASATLIPVIEFSILFPKVNSFAYAGTAAAVMIVASIIHDYLSPFIIMYTQKEPTQLQSDILRSVCVIAVSCAGQMLFPLYPIFNPAIYTLALYLFSRLNVYLWNVK